MKPIALSDDAGVVQAYLCGVCKKLVLGGYEFGDEYDVAACGRYAENCCTCSACGAEARSGVQCDSCSAVSRAEWERERQASDEADTAALEASMRRAKDPAAARQLLARLKQGGWSDYFGIKRWKSKSLRALAVKAGGWFAWCDGVKGVRFISLASWRSRVEASEREDAAVKAALAARKAYERAKR